MIGLFRRWLNVKALRYFFSGALLVAGLWQLEMVQIQLSYFQLTMFSLPFGVEVEWWFARDLFYSMIILAFLLVLPFDKLKRGMKT